MRANHNQKHDHRRILHPALAARGWRYKLDAEDFFGVSGRRLEWEDLIALVPGMTLTDLADWEASQRDERMQRAMK